MIIFLLIYSHIGAVVLGACIIELFATRKNWITDICAGLFIFALWPWALWLLYQKGVRS